MLTASVGVGVGVGVSTTEIAVGVGVGVGVVVSCVLAIAADAATAPSKTNPVIICVFFIFAEYHIPKKKKTPSARKELRTLGASRERR